MFVFRAGRIRIVNTHNCSDCSELVATTSIYIYISIDTVFCPIKTQYFVLYAVWLNSSVFLILQLAGLEL